MPTHAHTRTRARARTLKSASSCKCRHTRTLDRRDCGLHVMSLSARACWADCRGVRARLQTYEFFVKEEERVRKEREKDKDKDKDKAQSKPKEGDKACASRNFRCECRGREGRKKWKGRQVDVGARRGEGSSSHTEIGTECTCFVKGCGHTRNAPKSPGTPDLTHPTPATNCPASSVGSAGGSGGGGGKGSAGKTMQRMGASSQEWHAQLERAWACTPTGSNSSLPCVRSGGLCSSLSPSLIQWLPPPEACFEYRRW